MSYTVLGTVGNDTLNQTVDSGPGTIVGLAGGDCILTGLALVSVIGDSGSEQEQPLAGSTEHRLHAIVRR